MRPKAVLGAIVLVACGNGEPDPSPGGPSLGPDGSIVLPDAGPTFEVEPQDGEPPCAADTKVAERAALDLLVMLDSSESMESRTEAGTPKWQVVKGALSAFARDEASAGIGVALSFFPVMPPAPRRCVSGNNECGTFGPCLVERYCPFGALIDASALADRVPCRGDGQCPGTTCQSLGWCANDPASFCTKPSGSSVDCGGGKGACLAIGRCEKRTDLCEVSAYVTPKVPFALLPAGANAFGAALDDKQPDGTTPTLVALTGAIEAAKARRTSAPDRKVAILFVTDGLPTSCDPKLDPSPGASDPRNVAGLEAVAKSGVASDVSTYVIGVFSKEEESAARPILDRLAAAGGTNKATIVGTGATAGDQLRDALATARGAAIPCDLALPAASSGAVDFGRVNVQYTPAGGSAVTIPYVEVPGRCDPTRGGWHYDVAPSAGTPTRLRLCPASCAATKGRDGRLDTAYGCATEIIR
jgi:Mg-chelatase subunit ChlD